MVTCKLVSHHLDPNLNWKFLRGFWARGRVRGDRSVFVTSHRPVHLSRALLLSAWFVCISVQDRYFLFDGFACLLLKTLIIKCFCVNFTLRLLCSSKFRGQRSPPQRPVLRRSRNEPCSVTSYGARTSGRLVSQELLGALTAVDDDLCSACLFAEYWDTHSDRDAWLRQHLSSQFHSLAVLLHQWCCEKSASWARGAVHIPVFRSAASCKPTAPSSFTTTGGNGSKRRYAAITSGGRHRPRQSSSQPPVGPLLSKAAREQEEYQQVLEVTLNLIASLGHLPGLIQALAAWVALLAHAGLRAEDSQRLKVGSCGFTDVAVHGICRNPKPRGVSNMPWAALRCGVLDEDWDKHAWDNLLSFCSRLQLDFILPGVAGDFSSLDWSRWATKNGQVASLWFVLTHPQGIAPLSEEHALQFTPHSPRFFYTSVGSTFRFSVSERCAFGNWSEGSNMPKRYDSSFCGEQLTRWGELLGLLQAGWSPPSANAPGLPRAPSGVVGIPRTPTIKPILVGTCAPHQGASASLPPDMLERLSVAALSGLLRYYRSDLGDRKLHVAKSEHSKVAKCGFLLPYSSVTVSNPDRLLGEGVTLCGHACFNTTCPLHPSSMVVLIAELASPHG